MSNCHELDTTRMTLYVLILTFVILLRFYNTSQPSKQQNYLRIIWRLKTPASQSVSMLSYVHCLWLRRLDISSACLQTAWPSSEELFQIKFCTETY